MMISNLNLAKLPECVCEIYNGSSRSLSLPIKR